MKHLKRGRKLNRTPEHKRAMMRNMTVSLFKHGRITTTPAKAKEVRPFAEKLITLAKKGTLSARRRAISLLHDSLVVKSLFDEIGPRYADRPGGYTRILHLATTRVGDSAPQAIFELVEAEMKAKGKAAPVAAKVEDKAEATAPATEEKSEAEAPSGEGADGAATEGEEEESE